MVTCPYCHKEAVLVTTEEFYGRDYGTNIWKCDPCGAYTSTHGRTGKAKGTLAKKALRDLRMQAHDIVDPMWREGHMSRTAMYRWMSKVMGLSKDDTHIGFFNEDQCRLIIDKAKERWGE